ncbi:MAG TPA: hypothetical protein DEH25_02855 [Chloroflexi bacterium]|nr:hypothetical protein [Chloroflexota bacterium]HBY07800.1 hypothetical protein [Chloroflexota bacterium]
MSDKKISLEYANAIIYDLEKAFWDERGKGARFRTTKVGHAFFMNKILPAIESTDLEEILGVIENILQEEGLVSSISHEMEDRLLRVRVEGYVHHEVGEMMQAHDIEPFTCVPANLIVLAIEEKLDLPVELAEIKIEDGVWNLLLVLFEGRPTLD